MGFEKEIKAQSKLLEKAEKLKEKISNQLQKVEEQMAAPVIGIPATCVYGKGVDGAAWVGMEAEGGEVAERHERAQMRRQISVQLQRLRSGNQARGDHGAGAAVGYARIDACNDMD